MWSWARLPLKWNQWTKDRRGHLKSWRALMLKVRPGLLIFRRTGNLSRLSYSMKCLRLLLWANLWVFRNSQKQDLADWLAQNMKFLWRISSFPFLQLGSCVSLYMYKFTNTKTVNNYPPKWRWLAVDIYRAAERRGKYLTLVTETEGDNRFSICQSVNRYGEFQF